MGIGPVKWFLNGREVTLAELRRCLPSRLHELAESAPLRAGGHHCWPMCSDAAGVHPDQVAEAQAAATGLGVPTEFTPDGRAVFRSPRHRKLYCEAVGLYDRNGGYGDPQRKNAG